MLIYSKVSIGLFTAVATKLGLIRTGESVESKVASRLLADNVIVPTQK
jgi:hypothetical protein